MNIEKLENNIQLLATNLSEESFIYDLLLAYEQPKSSITRLQKGDYNLSKNPGEILWKKKLFFKKETTRDLHDRIDRLKGDPAITRHHPRFIIVTDFKTMLSVDTKTDDTLDISISELPKHYDFFLPWAGMEKSQLPSETLADIKAAEKMGRLYDLIAAGLMPFAPDRAAFKAGRLMLNEIHDHASKGESFAFETTLSGRAYARLIPEWQKMGYRIKLFFLRLESPELAIARVHQRVKAGGHNVPEHVIRRRLKAGLQNLDTLYKPLVDEWAVYDNSGKTPELIEEYMKL